MKRRCRYGILLMVFIACVVWQGGGASAHAEASSDMLDQFIPGESEMGITPGERTLDYRQYPPDHYTWDLGYDLVEWKGWKPKLNNPFPILLNWLSNGVFLANTFIVRFCIFLMQLAFHTDLVNSQLSLVLPIMDGLRQSLFVKFLPFALVLLATWMVKVGYWNNQTTRLTSGVVGSLVVLIGSYWFFAYSGQSIRAISGTMDKLTQITMGSLAAPYQKVTGENVAAGITNIADQQLLATSNRLWKLFVDRPWLIGQLNRQEVYEVTVTASEAEAIRDKAEEDEVRLPVSAGDAWGHLLREYSSGMVQRDILRYVLGSQDVDHGNHADIVSLFWGGSAGIRCLIAFLSLLASLTLLLFVGAVSLVLLLAQELALVVIVLAPIVLLLGIFPETGFAFVRRWIAWLIGVLGTKVVYGFYMGFTLLVADIVARGSGILMLQQIFVALLFFFAFLFRKKILRQIFSVFEAPTPHDIYDSSKREVLQHWGEAKQSWEQTKDTTRRANATAKKFISRFKKKNEGSDGDDS
ncbi:hypothetical protein B5M42_020980 [Paenibacillus athensensis]|uniref:TrbL/VirB6 plasmid conjugal transfer protein n=1 Tax=Paenibacillus athensensis TaxID=1967502 RepID=A0A4Y8PYP2_9BACL|nr:hypothetical protein [Paenibacillus athensensis]MCD1261279.1 hypothetical protein [Paenibacillus athensensis]